MKFLVTLLLAGALSLIAVGSGSATVPQSPVDDGNCNAAPWDDPSCGTGWGDSGIGIETFSAYGDDYDAYAGRCRTRWAKAHRQNVLGVTQYDYYEQVRYCWRNGIVTRFHRDRWVGQTGALWTFDGHIGTNCAAEGCDGRTGAYQENAWTQGHFHVGWTIAGVGYRVDKYPIINIYVYGDGGSYASVSNN